MTPVHHCTRVIYPIALHLGAVLDWQQQENGISTASLRCWQKAWVSSQRASVQVMLHWAGNDPGHCVCCDLTTDGERMCRNLYKHNTIGKTQVQNIQTIQWHTHQCVEQTSTHTSSTVVSLPVAACFKFLGQFFDLIGLWWWNTVTVLFHLLWLVKHRVAESTQIMAFVDFSSRGW